MYLQQRAPKWKYSHCYTAITNSTNTTRSTTTSLLTQLLQLLLIQLQRKLHPQVQLQPQPLPQKSQLMLTNPCDAFRHSVVKVTRHSIIPYVWYSFLLVWNSNFIVKRKENLQPLFDFKNGVTLKSGSEVTQGHWKWYHSTDWVWFPISVL